MSIAVSIAVPQADATWVIHCDGSAMPNPGRMGIGAVLIDPGGCRHTLSRAMPAKGCNNEAELWALIAALEAAQARGATALLAYSDSAVLIEQLGGAPARPIERLAGLFTEARALLGSFEQAILHWLPGHRNDEADALARAALGAPARRPARLTKRRK